MGLGLMVEELIRDEENKIRDELDRRSQQYGSNSEYSKKYYDQIEKDNIRYRKQIVEESINYNKMIDAEKQFNSMVEKLSKELNTNIHMLQTHKPVINLNLTININSCENPNETAEAVKKELNPILSFLK